MPTFKAARLHAIPITEPLDGMPPPDIRLSVRTSHLTNGVETDPCACAITLSVQEDHPELQRVRTHGGYVHALFPRTGKPSLRLKWEYGPKAAEALRVNDRPELRDMLRAFTETLTGYSSVEVRKVPKQRQDKIQKEYKPRHLAKIKGRGFTIRRGPDGRLMKVYDDEETMKVYDDEETGK